MSRQVDWTGGALAFSEGLEGPGALFEFEAGEAGSVKGQVELETVLREMCLSFRE